MPIHPNRGRGRKRRSTPKRAQETHSSTSTSRTAYIETRHWLLAEYGPVCAYCGVTGTARGMTLDHVTPRRSQSAYDRRDNLVLACKRCNSAKADKAFLIYLLAQPLRAVHLLRNGQHLSEGILDHVRHMAGEPEPAPIRAPAAARAKPRVVYGSDGDDAVSPYLEPSPYSD